MFLVNFEVDAFDSEDFVDKIQYYENTDDNLMNCNTEENEFGYKRKNEIKYVKKTLAKSRIENQCERSNREGLMKFLSEPDDHSRSEEKEQQKDQVDVSAENKVQTVEPTKDSDENNKGGVISESIFNTVPQFFTLVFTFHQMEQPILNLQILIFFY